MIQNYLTYVDRVNIRSTCVYIVFSNGFDFPPPPSLEVLYSPRGP